MPACAMPDNNPTPSQAAPAAAQPPASPTVLWAMLLTLLSAFALSQAFRTVTSIIADGLRTDFGLSAESLGAFAGLFGLSFGVTQLFMGVGMDLYGLRKTVLTAFPLAIAGSAISAAAPSYHWLMLGQLLIGIGCSPAFLACTMFISRHFPSDRFAFMSGVGMGVGGLGLLFTGTPLAWLVQHQGWRFGFGLLAALCALSWLAIFWRVHEPRLASDDLPKPSWINAVKGFGGLLKVPHTWAIALMGMVGYASFLTVRGLWLSPMLIDRYGFSLVATGNVALVVSVISLFVPSIFGRFDPGPARRRRRIIIGATVMASIFCALAFVHHPLATVALILLMGLVSGYSVLQYADVRSSYPKETTGRALSVYTMAMFLGVALMQWGSGKVAAWAEHHQAETYEYVMLFVAAMLMLGCLAFRFLPKSPLLTQQGGR